MSILSLLFGSRKQSTSTKPRKKTSGFATIGGSFLNIPSKDYYGFYKESQSKEWIVSWLEGENDSAKSERNRQGRLILYNAEKDEVIVDKRLQRPNQGHVANTGHSSVEDWLFDEGPCGKFYVFAPDGTIMVERRFAANIFNSAISENGIFAVCQMCSAKNDDGETLTMFDITRRKELFSIYPTTGRADDYEFDEEQRQLVVIHKGIGKFRYNADGEFLDREQFEDGSLASLDLTAILSTVRQKLQAEDLTSAALEKMLSAVLRAQTLLGHNPNGWDAIAFKLEGNISERLGRLSDAINAYENALSINPKIGVARRLSALKKRSYN
jgi:tetratricopeptide (TPR) repeat protein